MKTKTVHFTGMLLAAFVFAASPAFAANDEIKVIPLHFQKGASSATVTGSIEGYVSHDYKFGAKGGQSLTAHLASKNPSLYLNVFPVANGSIGEAMGDNSVIDWSGKLPKDGDYIIRVFLFRNEARRGHVAPYSLKVEIN